MIRISIQLPTTPDWQKWQNEVTAATQTLIQVAQTRPLTDKDIDKNLYKKVRDFLWTAFHGKCAYCESKYIITESGDVEHYRPKLGVTDEKDQPIFGTSPAGAPIKHPGYYWLAYDWQNLIPSCTKCNRPTTDQGIHAIGKRNRFPLVTTSPHSHGMSPGAEKNEWPAFLHPVFDNPEDYLSFDSRLGVILWKDERGEKTVKLLGLNREGLPEARKATYQTARAAVNELWNATRNSNADEMSYHGGLLERFKKGQEQYSWPGRIGLASSQAELQAVLQQLL